MQTRPTARLSSKLARYARKHSLRETARRYGILDPYGRPSKGMVRLLLDGYEPKTEATRMRIGLPAKLPRPPRPVTINQLMQLPVTEMPVEILKLALANREVMR
jgi:hypothetical protein